MNCKWRLKDNTCANFSFNNCDFNMECNPEELECETYINNLKQENQKLKYYLNKIREEELSSLDIEWDEYETCCRTTDYSNIINLVEKALGEQDE